jgi:hypothetical protein
MRRVTQRCVGATHESAYFCDGGDAISCDGIGSRCGATRSSPIARRSRARCLRASQMRWLARRHALEILKRQAGGTFRTSKAMELAGEPRRWARERAQQRGTIPMDQNLGELPASCARMQKKLRNEPNDIFCNQWLSVFGLASLAAFADGFATPGKESCRGTAHENLAITRPSTTRSCAVTYRLHGCLRRRGRSGVRDAQCPMVV